MVFSYNYRLGFGSDLSVADIVDRKTSGIYVTGRQDVSILGMQKKRNVKSVIVYADSMGNYETLGDPQIQCYC